MLNDMKQNDWLTGPVAAVGINMYWQLTTWIAAWVRNTRHPYIVDEVGEGIRDNSNHCC